MRQTPSDVKGHHQIVGGIVPGLRPGCVPQISSPSASIPSVFTHVPPVVTVVVHSIERELQPHVPDCMTVFTLSSFVPALPQRSFWFCKMFGLPSSTMIISVKVGFREPAPLKQTVEDTSTTLYGHTGKAPLHSSVGEQTSSNGAPYNLFVLHVRDGGSCTDSFWAEALAQKGMSSANRILRLRFWASALQQFCGSVAVRASAAWVGLQPGPLQLGLFWA